ncbi:DUF5719 family protein [Nocardioides sp. AE5]|uniref:DUF5719 family protein n=1 Tax=Nocardioides sp. AE5 TaxID=2962573 RepID=UPI00288152D2|nr:DUF5719 family protein [Nocardioides sp. AE5]MDT0201888.1 DUF5719 family protein [Nocardioides sp. AE5]
MSGVQGGRRMAGRVLESRPRISKTLAVGIAAVVVTAASVAGMRGSDQGAPEAVREAQYSPVTSQALSCPASFGADAVLLVGSLTEPGEGSLSTRPATGGEGTTVTIEAGTVATVGVGDVPTILAGQGSAARALLGARVRTQGPKAAAECTLPAPETWFTGAGAGGLHTSQLVLVNPDDGPAVADVTAWSSTGEVEASDLRGVTVKGNSRVVLDLAELVPTREELAVRVSVGRGRLAATVRDAYTPRGGSGRVDALQASAAPATDLLIPAFPRQSSEATLVLANPGENASRVSLSVVGVEAEFTPEGFEEIQVPAGQAVVTELPDAVTRLVKDEDTVMRLVASEPVVAGVRVVVAGDFAHLGAIAPLQGEAGAVVPHQGNRRLVLTTTGEATVADLEFVGASDPAKATGRLRLRPGSASAATLPAGTRAVVVRSSEPIVGAVRTEEGGIAWSPLRALVSEKIVPDVRPAW